MGIFGLAMNRKEQLMLRLDDFNDVIDKECKDGSKKLDADEVALLLQKAARDLLTRQVIHSDDIYYKSSYRLLSRHSTYYECLFDGLGYQIVFNSGYSYILLLPGENDNGSRRGRVSKEETLFLFVLRVLWEDGMRESEMDEFGRVETDTEILYDRFTTMSDADFPTSAKLKEHFTSLKSRGILRVKDKNKEEEFILFVIMPVISEIVTTDLARDIEIFLSGNSDHKEVFAHIADTSEDGPPKDQENKDSENV